MTGSTANAADPAAVAALIAKQEITEVLYRRARAGDRRDVELALSCYHEGATEEHEGFTGTAAEFTRNVSMISPRSKAPVTCLWHLISNILIELDEDAADVESYHIAVVVRERGSRRNPILHRRSLPRQVRVPRRPVGNNAPRRRLRLEPSGGQVCHVLGPRRA